MRVFAALALALVMAAQAQTSRAESRLEDVQVASPHFDGNTLGVSRIRRAVVYLPDGYDRGRRRYPVIYFLHNFQESHRALFDQNGARAVLDRSIAAGALPPVIVVSADFSTPYGASFFANSTVTGNWTDFLAQTLPAFMDQRYRTLPRPEARGLLGDRMGGYGAIRTAMLRPGVFGSVYALHPVGTGLGLQPMRFRPNFDLLDRAKGAADLQGDVFTLVFTTMYQAFLPNPSKPPLYMDVPVRRTAGGFEADPELTEKLQKAHLLDRMLPDSVQGLKTLRGFKYDWGRFDPNPDHVVSNRSFSLLLEDFGVPHEAEEYGGRWGGTHWTPGGRVESDVAPFFRRHLQTNPR